MKSTVYLRHECLIVATICDLSDILYFARQRSFENMLPDHQFKHTAQTRCLPIAAYCMCLYQTTPSCSTALGSSRAQDDSPMSLQASGQKAYAAKQGELENSLASYKYAQARWQGTDNGAYEAWMLGETFEPLEL